MYVQHVCTTGHVIVTYFEELTLEQPPALGSRSASVTKCDNMESSKCPLLAVIFIEALGLESSSLRLMEKPKCVHTHSL